MHFLYALLVGTAHAATVPSLDFGGTGGGISGQSSLGAMIIEAGNTALPAMLEIAAVLAVLYTVWAGFQFLTAGGSTEKTKAARQGLINGIIGIVVITGAFTIVKLESSIGSSLTPDSAATGSGSATLSDSAILAKLGFNKDAATGRWCRTKYVSHAMYPSGVCVTGLGSITQATAGTSTWYRLGIYSGAGTTDKWCKDIDNCISQGTVWSQYKALLDASQSLSATPSSPSAVAALNQACQNAASTIAGTGIAADDKATLSGAVTSQCPPPYGSHAISGSGGGGGGSGTASYHSPSYYDGDSAGCAAAGDDYVEVNPDGTESTDCRASAPASYVDEGDLAGSKARCEAAGYDWTDPKTTYDAEGNPTTTGASCN